MNKIHLLLLLSGFVSSFSAYCSNDVCHQMSGSLHCGKGDVDVIDFRGAVLMDAR